MAAPILIFSVDAIRGNIILNTLRFNGLEAVLQNRIIHVKEVIRKHNPPLIILDIKELSHNELDLIKSADSLLTNTPLIALSSPSEIDAMEFNEMKIELCKAVPLDAELITSKVKALLKQKSNGATVRQNKSTEVGSQQPEVQKSEETNHEESGDEEISLEYDLKKFLDLE